MLTIRRIFPKSDASLNSNMQRKGFKKKTHKKTPDKESEIHSQPSNSQDAKLIDSDCICGKHAQSTEVPTHDSRGQKKFVVEVLGLGLVSACHTVRHSDTFLSTP